MYIAQIKPKRLIIICRWKKLKSDFKVVREVVRQTNAAV